MSTMNSQRLTDAEREEMRSTQAQLREDAAPRADLIPNLDTPGGRYLAAAQGEKLAQTLLLDAIYEDRCTARHMNELIDIYCKARTHAAQCSDAAFPPQKEESH